MFVIFDGENMSQKKEKLSEINKLKKCLLDKDVRLNKQEVSIREQSIEIYKIKKWFKIRNTVICAAIFLTAILSPYYIVFCILDKETAKNVMICLGISVWVVGTFIIACLGIIKLITYFVGDD